MAGPSYHGRTHLPGGTDPIPGLTLGSGNPSAGSYEELILAHSALVGYWPLDEASGDALDHSGNGYHFDDADFGTLTQGEPGPFPGDPTATSYEFPSYSGMTRDTPDTATNALSVEIWVHPYEYPPGVTNTLIIQANGGAQMDLQLKGALVGNTGEMAFSISGGTQIESGVTVNIDEWTHVVGTCSNADAIKIYFNGVLMDTGSTASANINVGNLVFGGINGRLSQAAIYEAVLTPTEIADHYNAGIADPNVAAGHVLTADGSGGTSWEPPTIEVDY